MNVATDSADSSSKLHSRIEVMIVYADPLTRSRVMRIYQRLHQQLWQEFDFHATWWKFDYLAHPQIASAATENLAMADIVFFAIGTTSELPAPVSNWLNRWPIRTKGQGRSLLALLEFSEDATTAPSKARRRMQEAASRAEMDFLPYNATDSENQRPPPLPKVEPVDQTMGLPRLATRRHLPDRWGLNE